MSGCFSFSLSFNLSYVPPITGRFCGFAAHGVVLLKRPRRLVRRSLGEGGRAKRKGGSGKRPEGAPPNVSASLKTRLPEVKRHSSYRLFFISRLFFRHPLEHK